MNTLRQPLPRRVACLLMILLLLFQSARAVAPGPAWWTQHGVLDPDGARDDFAAANIGQLKYLATQADAALDEAEAASPVPLSSAQAQAKSAIDAMIAEWSALPLPGVPRDDFLALNAGQLKHVAALFYDRLGLPPPWAGAAPLGDDFRMVNVGQLKQAFSFELRLARGGPPVQIPASWWDTAHAAWAALDSTQRAAGSTAGDFNGNGLSNLEEYLMHPARLLFDPDDKDGDRIPDVAEAASGGILSPLLFADAVEDHDNDGVMNYEEVLLGLNLNGPVTTGRADGLTDAEVLAWGLLAGVPLAPGTDAVRACWEAIDEAWIEQQGGMEFYGHWLDRTPASGVPAGWTAFQAEFWGPTSPDAASIQYPPTPIDLDGDDIPDMDRDGDGLPDLWEYRHELDLRGAEDAWDDPDGDTLVNLMEFANGTNPRLADTDGDGFSDAEEGQHGGDPRQGGSVPPVLVQIIGESAHTHYPGQTTPALAVRATQAGIARMGVEITFTLTAGNGVLSPATQAGGGSAASLTLSTGADGIAAVTYTAAAHAEQAQVQAAAAGAAGTHVFTVHVIPMPPIFAGWGAGGGTTGSATAPPSAPVATAAVAAASDGMLIRVRRKYESDESFPGRDFKNSPSEYLGPNGMDPASSGGLNMPFDNPNLAHHTELTLQWASAGPARSRTYLVLVFKGRDAYARWAIIDGVRVGAPDMVGSVTFAVDQNGMLAVTTSGNLSGYMEKAAGEASVAFTQEPPTSEDERFVISLLPVEINVVNRDDPAKTWATGPVTSSSLAYTSPTVSEVPDVKNGDLISWKIPGLTSGAFQWWAIGPNGSRKDALSATGNIWKLEDPLDWLPGKWRIHCRYTPSGGAATEFDFEQKLGYRSPHVTVIGWVNGNEIILPDGTNYCFSHPTATVPVPLLPVGQLMDDFTYRNLFLGAISLSQYPQPLYPEAARKYVNCHLLKFSPNDEPPADFTLVWPGYEGRKMVDLDALRNFKADGELFRAFHQFQVRFDITDSGKISGEPIYIIPFEDSTEVGLTPTDIGNLSGERGLENGVVLKFRFQDTQINPKNGRTLSAVHPEDIAQINQGRIGTVGLLSGGQLSLKINNLVVPWIWSMIKFGAQDAKTGSIREPWHEIFPSYHILYNGRRIDSQTHQISAGKLEEFIQLGEEP